MSGPVSFNQLFDETGPGRQELDELAKSVQALGRSVRSLGKNLDTDAGRIGAGLASIVGQTAALREQASKLTLAADSEKAGLAALGAQVAQLAQQQQQALAAQAGQARIKRETTQIDAQAVATLKLLRAELKAAYAANDTARIEKAAIAVREYKEGTDQLNKALRGANSLLTATAGSYNRLDAETKQLGERIRALPGGFDNTSEAAVQMKKEFADNTQRLKDFDRELNQNFREVGSYAKGILEATRALNSQKAALTSELSALKAQANATHLSADAQRLLQAEIERTETELTKVTGELRGFGTAAGKAGQQSAGFSANAGGMAQNLLGAYLSITALTSAIGDTFSRNAQYSDQLADVRKTTGLTREATDELATSLKTVDTRTSLAGLLDIAKVGGQLGIAGKDIEGFTKSIDVAVQALGDDFSGGAEEIATELGKIGTVFRKELGPDVPAGITKIGSALNELGASGAATAPFLADVALRTGAVAANANLGLKDVLAYGAVLQETGFTAETSGTALNRLFSVLSTNVKGSFAIAKLADSNLTLKEFKKLVNTDFQGAISLFLKGLREGGTTTTSFNRLLGTLKLQSGEAKSVITTLAKNVDLLSEKQAIANDQLERGTSLATEAAIKNDNLAGSWAKLKNDVANFFTSGTGAASLKYFVEAARGALNLREGLGKTFGLVKDVSAADALLESTRKQVSATADVGTAAGLASAQAAELFRRYEALSSAQSRNGGQQQELAELTLQLRDLLGEKVVALNKETGAYQLNTSAVTQAIKSQQALKRAQAETLAKQLETIDAQLRAQKTLRAATSGEVDTRVDLLAGTGVDLNQAERLQANIGRGISSANVAKVPAAELDGLGVNREQLGALVSLREANDAYGKSVQQVEASEAQRALIISGLTKLGYSASQALALLARQTEATAVATDDAAEADKKKKRTVADLAKEEAALAKQRLEERLANLNRQSENPANTEAVRADALKKAAEVRIQIARVERDELIREAAVKYKDQIGGERALGVATIRLTEAFSAKRLGIERETNKALVELHNALLNQLAGTDKLIIETELEALDRIVENDQLGYQERQQAALDASARRVELIQIDADTERRAAKGNAEALRAIQVKEEKATAAERLKTRQNNADFANDELDKQYAQAQLVLEKSRAAGEITERQYVADSRQLDADYHAFRQQNFQDDVTKQKEALEQEKANVKEATDFKVAEELRLKELRAQLINEGLENVRGFSDAYFTIEANNNQARVEDLQRAKETELAVAGENEELKAQINEKFRQRELAAKRKQAQLDRAQALFNVAINTAQAVTSVLSTGGGTRYADFGISAGILSAIVIAQGIAQTVAILAKPLPAYFKGRTSGPAETALVAERGPELIGQPSSGFRLVAEQAVTQLAAGDRVYTATETRDVLRDHELVAGKLVSRRHQTDQEQQATNLRTASRGRLDAEAAEARAASVQHRVDTDRLIKAWHERPELRLTEEGLHRWTRRGDTWTEEVERRYKSPG
ncbi:MAG TPA: phage tail tape measure protein [Hymenobacter sp.]